MTGFGVSYEAGEGLHARIRVSTGFEGDRDLRSTDHQTVMIDDPCIPFTVEGEVDKKRLVRLTLTAPRAEITRGDVRAASFVPLVKDWAAVGREHQLAVKRHVDAVEGITESEATERVALGLDSALSRLFGDQAEALRAAREAMSRLSGRREGQRVHGAEAEELLERVVAEYRDAIERGIRGPRAVVAERLGYHHAHVGRLLTKARQRGMLPAAKPRGRHNKQEVS